MTVSSDFNGFDEGLGVVMMQVRKGFRTSLRRAAQQEGLTQNEIEVLLFLSHQKYNTAREISRYHGISRSLVSKSVDQLVRSGYVKATQDEADRRCFRLSLLPKAEETVHRLHETHSEFMKALCEGITQEEGEVFMSIVCKLKENLRQLALEAAGDEEPEDWERPRGDKDSEAPDIPERENDGSNEFGSGCKERVELKR